MRLYAVMVYKDRSTAGWPISSRHNPSATKEPVHNAD